MNTKTLSIRLAIILLLLMPLSLLTGKTWAETCYRNYSAPQDMSNFYFFSQTINAR